MTARQKRPKKQTQKKLHAKNRSNRPPDDEIAQENEFDYGGLPDRDLKKNLGCG